MAIRTTSIEVYKFLEENGTLSAKRWEIYATVYNHGPITSGEAFAKLSEGKTLKSLSQSRARFTELRGMGLLKETGERECKITGYTVIEWDVTDQLPLKLEKAPTRKEKIETYCKKLESLPLLVSDIFEREELSTKITKLVEELKNL